MNSLLLLAFILFTNVAEYSPIKSIVDNHRSDFTNQANANDEPSVGNGLTSTAAMTGYRLSGEKSLRPSRIGDDGVHTYIEWSEEQALPAVFAVNALGEEEIVDGYMRQDIFTIDRVHQRLVFRIGKKLAKAERAIPPGGVAHGE
jgi:type IV secretion system protein VirB9